MGQHPARGGSAVTFTQLLHDLVGLNGRQVHVTVGGLAWPPAALSCVGRIQCGAEVTGSEPEGREVFFFPLGGAGLNAFLIDARAFTGARWLPDGALSIELGSVVLEVEPLDA
jgi:hypothetical protein